LISSKVSGHCIANPEMKLIFLKAFPEDGAGHMLRHVQSDITELNSTD